jgi:hypothetical protein
MPVIPNLELGRAFAALANPKASVAGPVQSRYSETALESCLTVVWTEKIIHAAPGPQFRLTGCGASSASLAHEAMANAHRVTKFVVLLK